jgi:hypothetical protein
MHTYTFTLIWEQKKLLLTQNKKPNTFLELIIQYVYC